MVNVGKYSIHGAFGISIYLEKTSNISPILDFKQPCDSMCVSEPIATNGSRAPSSVPYHTPATVAALHRLEACSSLMLVFAWLLKTHQKNTFQSPIFHQASRDQWTFFVFQDFPLWFLVVNIAPLNANLVFCWLRVKSGSTGNSEINIQTKRYRHRSSGRNHRLKQREYAKTDTLYVYELFEENLHNPVFNH